jgi:hypothetical protein
MAALKERLIALEERVTTLEGEKQGLRRRLRGWKGTAGLLLLMGLFLGYPQLGQAQGTLEQRVAVLEGKLARVSVANNGADIIISGANLNIINRAGNTQTATCPA